MKNSITAIVCVGGPIYCISVQGTDFYFELHPWCGLMSCTRDGDEREDLPPEHPFWTAVHLWHEQGAKVENGKCVYDPDLEVVPILKHLVGQHYLVVGHETVGQRNKRLAVPGQHNP